MRLDIKILIFALLALAVPLPANAGFIPPSNLPAGSEYELVFVTSSGTNADSPYVADYNAFVTAQAEENPNLPQGITWNAIASTSGDVHGLGQAQANENAPFTSSIPVYNTAGQLIADAATPLYGGSLIDPILYNQYGNEFSTPVWTGSNADGTPDHPLGGQNQFGGPDFGESTFSTGGWIHGSIDTQATAWPLYALSSPITVVPEPGTFTLLAVGAAAIGTFALRRRWRQ